MRWNCTLCGTTDSVWACLHCGNFACGRTVESHAKDHYHHTSHPLVLEITTRYAYW
jgi:uncharacterized UBP type Zn finger protein